jgi:uncharacterized iron-regulated membrane protein
MLLQNVVKAIGVIVCIVAVILATQGQIFGEKTALFTIVLVVTGILIIAFAQKRGRTSARWFKARTKE